MYFIVEGTADVLDLDEKTSIFTLKRGELFGEMGIINFKPGLRSRSIKASTDLSIAAINLDSFKFICTEFPEVYAKIQEKVEERKKKN